MANRLNFKRILVYILLLVLFFILIIILNLYFPQSVKNESNRDFLEKSVVIMNDVKQSYPLLNDIDIEIKLVFLDSGAAEAHKLFFSGYEVLLDYDDLKNADEDVLKGLFAHELAHLEDYSSRLWFSMIVFGIKYALFDSYKKEVERKTDLSAIEHGFKKEFYEFRKYRLETGSKSDLESLEENYLSLEEIESYGTS
ncbi:MAG: hypothetical protein AABY22_07550 [Nanoarchaeota archaeon]